MVYGVTTRLATSRHLEDLNAYPTTPLTWAK